MRDKQDELITDIYRAKLVYQAEMKSPEYRAKGEEDFEFIGKALAAKGYRKASEVAKEIFAEIDDFQRTLRHIFLDMCEFNDYNTLNLLQIDNAIEALYDTFIAELKKKYTEGNDG